LYIRFVAKKKYQKNRVTETIIEHDNSTTPNNLKTENYSIKYLLKYIFGILAITFIAFFPSLQNDFVFWDDPEYVLNNPFIKELNLGKLFDFSTFYMGNYHPLAMVSLALDYKLWEFNPFGYHLTNVIFHLLNTALVFGFIYQLFSKNRLEIATVTALLFGIHPMHVESVTWISERKDVLYTFFFMGSLMSYAYYSVKGYDKKWLGLSFALFALSCFAKGQAVVLAPIIVLIDLFQKRKIELKSILEKTPFFLLSLFFGLKAIEAQKAESAINANYEGLDTIFYGSYGILTYIYKMILPLGLSGAHPYPSNPVFEPIPDYFKILPLGVIALAGLVYWFGKKHRVVWFGTLFYLGSIAIVLKFVPVGDAVIAERYTYIPYIGLFMIVGYIFAQLYNNPKYKNIAVGVLGAITILLSIGTFQRTKTWKNTFSFWENVSETYPNYWRSYNCMGQEYIQMGNKQRDAGNEQGAKELYNKAIEQLTLSCTKDKWAPPVPYLLRGAVYTDNLQQYDKAIQDYKKVLTFPNINDPSQIDGRHNLGLVYYRIKKYSEAIKVLSEAVQMNPNHPKGYYFRGLAFAGANKPQQAVEDYNKAIQIDPNFLQAYLNRGVMFTDKINQPEKGIADFQKVLQYNPNHQDAIINSGICYYKMKKHNEADQMYNRALQLNPKNGRVFYLKALNFGSSNRKQEAYNSAIQAKQLGMNIPDVTLNQWK
jgi:tetratricopeptide (TPR) repeat protein